MDTLQERLGVAVESDAVRYSGQDFSIGHGASVVRRVRRRRAARAAGYGSGTVLAVGALAVGGAKLPWGGFGVGTLGVGAEDCATPRVTAMVDAAAPSALPSVATTGSGRSFEVSTLDGSHTATVVMQGREPTLIGETAATIEVLSDGAYAVVFPDGTVMKLDLRFQGDSLEVVYYAPLRPDIETGISAAPDIAQPSGGPSTASPSPSPSVDCVTPTPTPSASWVSAPEPEPSWGGEISAEPGVATSPFQCGFEFPAPVGSTGIIAVGAPRWFSAGEAEAAIRSAFGDPESVDLAPSGADVPQVVYTSISTWPGGNYGGETGYTDPAEQQDLPTWTADGVVQMGGHVDGAQFVLEADDVVIATYSRDGSAGATQFLEPYDVGAGTLYGLDLTSGFDACPGVDPAILEGAQAVAVAGTKVVNPDGTEDGPYYAWHYITRA